MLLPGAFWWKARQALTAGARWALALTCIKIHLDLKTAPRFWSLGVAQFKQKVKNGLKKNLEIWKSIHVFLSTLIKNLFVFMSLPMGECYRTLLWHPYCMQLLQGKLLPLTAAAAPKPTWMISLLLRYCNISFFHTASEQISILWAVSVHYMKKHHTQYEIPDLIYPKPP